jgi:hypothetical protein
VDADAGHKHPLFHPKLDAIGYGFLIPVFFVTSGLTFNLSVLFSSGSLRRPSVPRRRVGAHPRRRATAMGLLGS